MKHLSRVAFCATALVVIALGTASAAQAYRPEWGTCTATGGSGGRYADAACTEKATRHRGQWLGGYEWTALSGFRASTPESVGMSGDFVLETAAGKRIECPTVWEASNIEIAGPSGALTPRWQFIECSSEGQECNTQFEEEGEINTIRQLELAEEGKGWTGRLGFISGKGTPSPVVGMQYTPAERERLMSPIVCAGGLGTVWIGGASHGPNSIISEIQPVNQMASSFTETFSQSAPGHGSPERFEAGPRAGLQAFLGNHWEPVSLTADLSYSFRSALELRATR